MPKKSVEIVNTFAPRIAIRVSFCSPPAKSGEAKLSLRITPFLGLGERRKRRTNDSRRGKVA